MAPTHERLLKRLATTFGIAIALLLALGGVVSALDESRPNLATQVAMEQGPNGDLPDLVVLVRDLPAGADFAAVDRSVTALDEVESVVVEANGADQAVVHVSLHARAGAATPDLVLDTVAAEVPDAELILGGRVAVDRTLVDRVNRALVVAVVPVLVLIAAFAAATIGTARALVAAGSIALATLLSGLVAAQLVGSFDGSLGSTAMPSVLCAVLISSVLTFRLLDWFTQPIGSDPSAWVRLSVRSLIPEVVLLHVGLVGAALVVELIVGPAPISAVAFSSMVATVVTLATVAPGLATFGPLVDDTIFRPFNVRIPDGRDFPLAVLGGFACFLLALGLFATRAPSRELLDESALAPGVAADRVARELAALGGDPTSAILVEFDPGADAAAMSTWAAAASQIGAVAWVETSAGRFTDGVLAEGAAAFVDETTPRAVVTPVGTARAVATQRLVDALPAVGGYDGQITLRGTPIAAGSAVEGGTLQLWLLIGALSLAGAAAVMLLMGDLMVAASSAALRLLGLAALVGVYRLVAGETSSIEAQILVLVVGVGVGLFELGFVRRLSLGRDGLAGNGLVTSALSRDGRAGMVGLVIVALTSLGLVASDLAMLRRLAVGLVAGILIELVVGIWLLRPALLADLAGVSNTAAAARRRGDLVAAAAEQATLPAPSFAAATTLVPDTSAGLPSPAMAGAVPSAGAASMGAGGLAASSGPTSATNAVASAAMSPGSAAEAPPAAGGTAAPGTGGRVAPSAPEWRRIIGGLLRAEFDFQADPGSAELETVFVEKTPLWDELVDHHAKLRAAGVRVTGRGPMVRVARVINDSSPVTLEITVDHPVRHLIDGQGRVVGRRAAERRNGMLWLVQDPSGRYRIAEAVDLGTAAATEDEAAISVVEQPSIAMA